nr:S8 family peptidase [Saprospiraceae bacterium]
MYFKVVLPVLIVFLLSLNVFSQAEMNLGAKKFFAESSELLRSGEQPPAEFIAEYDLTSRTDKWYIGVLALVDKQVVNTANLQKLGVKNDSRLNDLWTLRVPVRNLEKLVVEPGIRYLEIADPVDPALGRSTIDSRTDSVNRGLGLSAPYNGEGVIIAVIDWGFDYTHPNFYDSTLTDLRLTRAWDQNKLSGPPPNGYSFGTEYVGKEELLAARQDTLYVFGPMSHGTHVAGIAGGSGAGTPHKGAAPEAELIFISLRRDAPSLIDAFTYITDYAASVEKPYVVNMSFGSHLGPHDGSSLKNYGIDMLHGPGRVFVGSAGNNGNSPFHLDIDFAQHPDDTVFTEVGFGNFQDQFGQTLSMWGSALSSFGAGLLLVDQANSIVYESPLILSESGSYFNEVMDVDGNELHIISEAVAQFYLNDKPNVRIEVRNTTPYRVILKVFSQDSHLHIWNNVRMNSRYTNWGQPLSDTYPGALAGDIFYGLGEPAGVGKNVITVGSYQRVAYNIFGNPSGGQQSNFTSSGPTVDGRVKPDISSTGQGVISSVNSFDPTQSGFLASVEHEGKEYGFRGFSGTSMSGPMVAGIVALMLEAHPTLSATQAKQIIIETARLDEHTGEIGPEGHLRWGYGKANALAAVLAVQALTDVTDRVVDNDLLKVYPNPVSGELFVEASYKDQYIEKLTLIDLSGRSVKSLNLPSGTVKSQMDLSDVVPGLYLLQFQTTGGIGFSTVKVAR